ncbi:hypothetical protein [Pseudoalteromonas luteoviolacea]|uniref:hypothetical protein n=1 Tax=Pseudoalteromonas luteoviolacea TaxID=43657 RepID=UPI001150683C|nr:hypothetical protein [Pseudoalteromonas luteoviolacea]TQF70841.1 hypothetical protein FLM44_07070 [Pseudoalteromonas luteoviolacea]
MKLIWLLTCVTSSAFAFEKHLDFSDRIVVPEVQSVSVSSYTRTQFDKSLMQDDSLEQAEHVGKIYSLLTPDEQIKYKYNRGLLFNTVTFEQYHSVSTRAKEASAQHINYIFWGK